MPITITFTITSGVALILHFFYLRRVWLNRRAQQATGINGDLARIANAFVNMESTRFAINACFFLAGMGILFQHRELGYLLAAPPVLSLLSSTFALRGVR